MENKRDDEFIQQRLDCGLATMEWIHLYLEEKILHEALEGSDDAMLILQT